jgi:hypothetical protein
VDEVGYGGAITKGTKLIISIHIIECPRHSPLNYFKKGINKALIQAD